MFILLFLRSSSLTLALPLWVRIPESLPTNVVICSLWIKPTDALNSSFTGITTLHVSGSISAHHQEFLAVHRLWYILCSCDRLLPGVTLYDRSVRQTDRSIPLTTEYIQFHPTSGSKRSQLHKMYQSRCTAMNSWWWAERLPETWRVVTPIKLEFSASVGFGFIHKEWNC